MFMEYLAAGNVIVLGLLGIIWNTSTWSNVAIKILLIVFAVANLMAFLTLIGYVVKH